MLKQGTNNFILPPMHGSIQNADHVNQRGMGFWDDFGSAFKEGLFNPVGVINKVIHNKPLQFQQDAADEAAAKELERDLLGEGLDEWDTMGYNNFNRMRPLKKAMSNYNDYPNQIDARFNRHRGSRLPKPHLEHKIRHKKRVFMYPSRIVKGAQRGHLAGGNPAVAFLAAMLPSWIEGAINEFSGKGMSAAHRVYPKIHPLRRAHKLGAYKNKIHHHKRGRGWLTSGFNIITKGIKGVASKLPGLLSKFGKLGLKIGKKGLIGAVTNAVKFGKLGLKSLSKLGINLSKQTFKQLSGKLPKMVAEIAILTGLGIGADKLVEVLMKKKQGESEENQILIDKLIEDITTPNTQMDLVDDEHVPESEEDLTETDVDEDELEFLNTLRKRGKGMKRKYKGQSDRAQAEKMAKMMINMKKRGSAVFKAGRVKKGRGKKKKPKKSTKRKPGRPKGSKRKRGGDLDMDIMGDLAGIDDIATPTTRTKVPLTKREKELIQRLKDTKTKTKNKTKKEKDITTKITDLLKDKIGNLIDNKKEKITKPTMQKEEKKIVKPTKGKRPVVPRPVDTVTPTYYPFLS
jgi:hypothetical protein